MLSTPINLDLSIWSKLNVAKNTTEVKSLRGIEKEQLLDLNHMQLTQINQVECSEHRG